MREICDSCKRPKTACFCQNIVQQNNFTTITILVHPDEIDHPLGTAKMAQFSFSNTKLFTGIHFQDHSLLKERINKFNSFVLYPTDDAINITEEAVEHNIEHLIIVDGSWRKAKRLLRNNRFLEDLPKIKFTTTSDSIYELRKAPKKNQLSTIEAITKALNIIEEYDYNSALKVLTKQIALHKYHIKINKNTD